MSNRRYVLKFYLDRAAQTVLHLPTDAQIIAVHAQDDMVCIWLISSNKLLAPVIFTCMSTGQVVPDDAGQYIGTAFMHNGRTVVHVFKGETL